MDWAGIVVERLTRMKLNDYMRQYIFEPLRIKDLSFVPSLDMKSRMAGFWHRDAEGKLSRRCYPLSTPLSHGQNPDLFQSGGAGLFGCVRDFSSRYLSQTPRVNVNDLRYVRDLDRLVKQRDVPYHR